MSIGSKIKGALTWWRDSLPPVKKTAAQRRNIKKVHALTGKLSREIKSVLPDAKRRRSGK
jgi:hypothetical protein